MIRRNASAILLFAAMFAPGSDASAQTADVAPTPEIIIHNARVATMNPDQPWAVAFIVKDGKFAAVGDNDAILAQRTPAATVIDAGGRTVIPGLNDSHLHATRGGRFYNLELRWDGVSSLRAGLDMIRSQAARTPDGQWVRVIGGWSPYQFAERRMPTIAELNRSAPDTPVFVLFLYSQGFLNAAGVRALGLSPDSKPPAGGRYEFVDGGAILHAAPDPTILYQTIARLPQLSKDEQANSTRQFYRELNRFGLTSVIDAGGGGHQFPDDYSGSQQLAGAGTLPIRISYYLFPQRPGKELDDFVHWTTTYDAGHNADAAHDHGFELEGGGEFLVWSAGDFENFMADRPNLDERGDWRGELHRVATHLVKSGWPLRIHATYDQSIAQILDVFEQINREQGRFAPRWAIDHAETVTEANLRRIHALGGGIAIQNRMSFAGEFFIERYGPEAARSAPPIRAMRALNIPVGAGTDATRVSSYNPWLALHWLVTGETVGGTRMTASAELLSREVALELYTVGSAWFSQEENVKGRIAAGQYADFAVLDRDYFAVPPAEIKQIESLLTVVAGQPVYAAGPYAALAPPAPKVIPDWSPAAHFGGYPQTGKPESRP